jgi:Ca2+/Na+ antiporter
MICYLLGAAKIKIGFAFGLFAIFSIIRYRTIVVSIKDMGYFFVCVSLGMLNSLANISDDFSILIICNLVILTLTFALERLNFINNENSKEIVYDNVNLIKKAYREDLIKDLNDRTDLNIHKVDVVSINYLKDTAVLKVYYYAKESENILPTTVDNGD